MLIRIAGVVDDSIVDGVGLRLAVFVQGCPHGCAGCHNPETWDFNAGTVMDTDDIVEMMKSNPLITGLTLTGGEPFVQAKACGYIAQKAHELGLDVWCYTGFEWEYLTADYSRNVFSWLLDHVDVLVDGGFVAGLRTLDLPWRGSKNQRLIDVKKSKREGRVVEWDGCAE